MEPSEPRAFPPVEAGALLITITLLSIGARDPDRLARRRAQDRADHRRRRRHPRRHLGRVHPLPRVLRLMPGALAPRPLPQRNAPLIYGSIVVAAALPLFLIFGWPLAGWAIAAVLWVAGQLVARVLQRQPIGMGNLASSGAVAMGRMVRTITAGVVLVVGDRHEPERRGRRARGLRNRVLGRVRNVARDVLRRGGKDVKFEGARSHAGRARAHRARRRVRRRPSTRPTSSSSRTGSRSTSAPLDLSINRAVVYLLVGAALSILLGLATMRWRLATVAGHAADRRRGDLRHRADPGRRDGPADEGDGALVPLLRHAADLHLRREPARVHPAAVHRPDLPRRARSGGSTRRRRRSR